MTFSKEDRISVKECWSDVYLRKPKIIYVIENIGEEVSRIRNMYGTVMEITNKTLYEIFTKTL